MCPECGEVEVETNISGQEGPNLGEVEVETNISGQEGPNLGKRFYKCPIDSGPDKCGWFKWEDAYAGILRRRQAAALRARNNPRQQVVNHGFQGQMPVPQAPLGLRAHPNMRGGPNWMTIALMANTTVNIILTLLLIGRI